jgi:hypothetical protein
MQIRGLLRLRSIRGIIASLVVLIVVAALVFWFGPFRPSAAALELLALDSRGRFTTVADMTGTEPDTAPQLGTGVPRLPLVLALHNTGNRPGRIRFLDLYIPAFLLLYDAKGQPIAREREGGNPLAHYRFELPRDPIEAGGLPVVLPGHERLWLESAISPYVCVITDDGVPDFRAAPRYDPVLLSQIEIFYSLSERTRSARSTGLLTLRIDPRLMRADSMPQPPIYPTLIRGDTAALDTSQLRRLGTREASCGEVDVPLTIQSISYATPMGGRVFAITHEGKRRKYLFDTDGDSVIDAEVWDPDLDGMFDAARRARFPIPTFLLPFRMRPVVEDVVPPDSAWLQLFYDTASGPLRFLPPELRPKPDTTTPPVRRDTLREAGARAGGTA